VEQISATRSELLARRTRLDLALRGRDLLEEKRNQLMEEFRRAAEQVLAQSDELDRAAADARYALALAEIADGPETVRSAALASRRTLTVEARPVTVTGVRIAEIDYPPIGLPRFERGYPPTSGSPHLDRVASRFESQLELVLRLAAYEVRLRRVAEEIGTTTRRVNALDTVVIPHLRQQIRAIHSRLEETERQDRFRLKRFKERRAGHGATRDAAL
jgi:V/A-type H+-transporting ATPase subunit D